MHWPTAFVYVPFDGSQRGFPMEYEPDQCSTVVGDVWENTHWEKTGIIPPHLQRGITIHETYDAMIECHKAGLVKSIGVCNFQ
eukprot:Awhi_evm1s6704